MDSENLNDQSATARAGGAGKGKMLVRVTEFGLYCDAGDFHIDPWHGVDRAVITHAHTDHARPKSKHYLCAQSGRNILSHRLGSTATIQTVEYGETIQIGEVTVSLHPAGHILGSSQVRLEHRGQVCVISGDYKTQPDPTCAPFEPLKCNTFISESTFGLPIYRWPDTQSVIAQINQWWFKNKNEGKASLLFCYSLGKAQRILSDLDHSIGPIYSHGAVEIINEIYRASGIVLPPTQKVADKAKGFSFAGGLILAPLSVQGTPWLRRLGSYSTAFASGWMRVRGMRRRRAIDRGFVISDHCDWPSLLEVISQTGAEQVFITHGYTDIMARHLNEHGISAEVMQTEFHGEMEETASEISEDSTNKGEDQ